MRVYYPVYATTDKDAIDIAERRARDAGHTVRHVDEVKDLDEDRWPNVRMFIVWLSVDEK